MKKIVGALLILVLCGYLIYGEADSGTDKAGSAMMGDFLKLNWDPASYALADAYSGVSDNFAGSIFMNPAGIARLLNSQFTLSPFYIPSTNIKLFFAGVEQNFGIEASMAVGGAYLDWGEEDETDGTGHVLDTFRNRNTMVFASFGSVLGGGLYLGFTAKFIDQVLYNTYRKTVLADVGLQFIPEVFKQVGIGASVTNIGIANKMAYDDKALKAPTTFHLGWVIKLIDTQGSGLSVSFDNTFPVDGAYKLSFGGELNLGNTIILRGGYKALGWDIPELTLGFGLGFSNSLKLDVAYSKKGNLGSYELASLTVIFGGKKKMKEKDWTPEIKKVEEKANTNTKTIEQVSEELETLKELLAQSSSELRKALTEQKQMSAEELAKKEAQSEAEKEVLRQQMAADQKKAVEEAAKKAAEDTAERLRKEYEARFNKIKEEVSKDKYIELREDKRGIVLNLQGIKFASGKATIPPYAFPTLDRVAKILSQYPDAKIRVEGHTDSQGSEAYNQRLSNSRAHSVMLYFVEKQAIDPNKIDSIGYGESKPIADNGTPEGRARNRRVEIIIMGTQKVAPKAEKSKETKTSKFRSGDNKVCVGSYDNEKGADTEVRKLQELGYDTASYEKVRQTLGETSKIIYRVKIGSFDEESANRLVDELKAKGFDAWIKK